MKFVRFDYSAGMCGTDSYEFGKFDDDITVVKRNYKTNNEEGTIAIIGPKRMEYDRVISLLDYVIKELEGK